MPPQTSAGCDGAGFAEAVVEPADITLEDVFTELATRQPAFV